MTRIRATSRVLAVLGDPVAHSLSPFMYNAAISALGLDAAYVALRVPGNAVAAAVAGIRATGMAGNVTVPLKVAAAECVDHLSPAATRLGAVNTFWCDGDRVHGDNTDAAGVLAAVDTVEAESPWLLAGTGGAARAVADAARDRGATLLVRSREPDRAASFVSWACEMGADARIDDGSAIATAVNATPIGLATDDPAPFADDRLAGATAAIDCVYATGGTAWIRSRRVAGLRAVDGRVMLVAQGAESFERFFDLPAPREVMRAAVDRALRS